ncbi:MAG: hypothetical protein ABIE70_02195 [bacterium]
MLLRLIPTALLAALLALVIAACGGDDDTPFDSTNNPPVIDSMTATPDTFQADLQTTVIKAFAHDPDGDQLAYQWEDPGSPIQILDRAHNPTEASNCCHIDDVASVYCVVEVSDGRGGEAIDSVQIWVRPL